MLIPGMRVKILYPEYVKDYIGYLVTQELSGRWIVKLETNPLNDSKEPLLLSLEESEFEVINSE